MSSHGMKKKRIITVYMSVFGAIQVEMSLIMDHTLMLSKNRGWCIFPCNLAATALVNYYYIIISYIILNIIYYIGHVLLFHRRPRGFLVRHPDNESFWTSMKIIKCP